MWIWQRSEWPALSWDRAVVGPLVSQVRLYQGVVIGVMASQSQSVDTLMLNTLTSGVVDSSAIEGAKLNDLAVRDSLAKKFGLPVDGAGCATHKTDALAEMMFDAIDNLKAPLTLERVMFWHQCLFPKRDEMYHAMAGGQLRGSEPVRVVSVEEERTVVRFEAPGRESLDAELAAFVEWFNASGEDTTFDPLVRAAIAHLWFLTLQPFEDGNGRITRLLTDLALAQAEPLSIRYYSMSGSVLENKQSYLDALSSAQSGGLDVTEWLVWFFNCLLETFDKVLMEAEGPLFKSMFWRDVDQTKLTKEQLLLIDLMLEGKFESGISAAEYLGLARVSKPTATRHLSSLVDKGCLVRCGAGRSTRYVLRG